MKLETCSIDVGDGDVKLDLHAIVPITDDLTLEFQRQPSLYAYISVLAARAEACWLDSKRELDRTYASMDKDVRRDLALAPGKVTEAMVEAEIKLRKGYNQAQIYELDCREQHLVMQAITRAMEMRAQMLMSLGAHLREEARQTGMYIKDVKETLSEIRSKTGSDRRKIEDAVSDNDAVEKVRKGVGILRGTQEETNPPPF